MTFSQPYSGIRRILLLRQCRLQGPGVDASGVVCNISIAGCFVAMKPVPSLGDRVNVSFQLPWWDRAITLDAVVCWDNSDGRAHGLPPGCGLAFLAPATADRQRIEDVIRAFARTPGGGR